QYCSEISPLPRQPVCQPPYRASDSPFPPAIQTRCHGNPQNAASSPTVTGCRYRRKPSLLREEGWGSTGWGGKRTTHRCKAGANDMVVRARATGGSRLSSHIPLANDSSPFSWSVGGPGNWPECPVGMTVILPPSLFDRQPLLFCMERVKKRGKADEVCGRISFIEMYNDRDLGKGILAKVQ
ncbi:hypothetical protein BaRGS_00001977, partial [Batillaria attramentaria]